MFRGCLTVFLALAGVFCVSAVLVEANPCDREDDAPIFFLLFGLVSIGAAAFGIARALTPRVWVALTAVVMFPVVLGSVMYVVLLFRWVAGCAS